MKSAWACAYLFPDRCSSVLRGGIKSMDLNALKIPEFGGKNLSDKKIPSGKKEPRVSGTRTGGEEGRKEAEAEREWRL
ncbi:hypothetical protein EYF80_052051 [Liparis tanakae]|uniref:Uncharacterized protein n=1 Tax=Liparis tanakae TaxID=230148 RepID=A0A4Z2FA87_9TELE|nr:hypothetical protein EYF80_052051 [Liparis tanakae]